MDLIKESPKFTPNQALLALAAFAIVGAWFTVYGFSIRSFIGKQEIQARLTVVAIQRFNRFFSYEYLLDGKIVKDGIHAIISNSYNVGDDVTILYNPRNNKSYMKDLVIPNSNMNFGLALVSWGVVIWGVIRYVITMYIKKKYTNSTEDRARPA